MRGAHHSIAVFFITTFFANFLELRKAEVRRIPLPHSQVNKGERMSGRENTGRNEGSVPIMGTTTRSAGEREVDHCERLRRRKR